MAPVTVRVLGTFAVAVDGRDVPLGGPRAQAVLARLVCAGDGPLSAYLIADDVWGGRAGPATVHAYVSRLRRLLGEAALPRRAGGYGLDRHCVRTDAEDFADEVARGRQALEKGRHGDAARLLGDALARWSGPRAYGPLAAEPFVAADAQRLNGLRADAAEALADAHVRLERPAESLALLEELAAADPMRESLALRLIRGLYGADRQADALAAYDRCRRALADQLGVDPSPPLRDMYAAVLRQSAPLPVRPAPVHLPPRNPTFTGRAELLSLLERALDDETAPAAVALVGLPGVGKTQIATELAHRRRTPGGVAWWVVAEDRAGIATSLADLAAALGVRRQERDEDTRAALWHELDRSPGWLLVFDNADDPDLIEPFLPAARHGDVLITSFNAAWRRLARPVRVPPFTRTESVRYVIARTGSGDHETAGVLAGLLGDLPLALEQASAYLEQTGMPLPDYVRLFARRHDALLGRGHAGDPRRTAGTTWDLAFDRLSTRSALAAEVLQVAAFLASDDIPVALLGPLAADELDLQDAIGELLRMSLADREASALRVHRLVQDAVRAGLPLPVRRERLESAARLVTAGASPQLAPHLITLAGHAETLGLVPGGFLAALSRLARWYSDRALYPAAEQVLRAALRLDRSDGALTCQLGEVLDLGGRLTEALDLHRAAVRMLEADGGRVADLAHAYHRLGHVLNCADDATGAIAAHERALALSAVDLVPAIVVDLGYTLWGAGRYADAGATFRRGLALLEGRGRAKSRDWAHATAGLALAAQDLGELDEALGLLRTALDMFTTVCGDEHPDTAQTMDKLGYLTRLLGRPTEAAEWHERAVRLLEAVLGPDDSRVAMTLTNLGLDYADAGRADEAAAAQSRAYGIFLALLGPAHQSTQLAARRLAAVTES